MFTGEIVREGCFFCSPTIGEDFLSDLDLRTVQCIVGGALTRSPNHMLGVGSVERLRLSHGTQIRHIAEVCCNVHWTYT